MAKIQYIRPSSIEFDSPSTASGISTPAESKADPSLKVMLGIGVFGVVIAVVALLFAISATQSKTDAQDLLKESFEKKIGFTSLYFARYLSDLELIQYKSAMEGLKRSYTESSVGQKAMHRFSTSKKDIAFQTPTGRARVDPRGAARITAYHL